MPLKADVLLSQNCSHKLFWILLGRLSFRACDLPGTDALCTSYSMMTVNWPCEESCKSSCILFDLKLQILEPHLVPASKGDSLHAHIVIVAMHSRHLGEIRPNVLRFSPDGVSG